MQASHSDPLTDSEFSRDFHYGLSCPIDNIHLTTAERSCQWRLQCQVLSQATERPVLIHRRTPRPFLAPSLRPLSHPASLLTEIRSVGSSPSLLAWPASRSATPWPRRVAGSDGSQPVITSNSGLFQQSAARFHQPLLQAGQRPVANPVWQHHRYRPRPCYSRPPPSPSRAPKRPPSGR